MKTTQFELNEPQVKAWTATTRIRAMVGGTGCIAPATPVQTTAGEVAIGDLAEKEFSVMTLLGASFAYAFRKGYAPLYRVRHAHGEIITTLEHRFLVLDGARIAWRSLSDLPTSVSATSLLQLPAHELTGREAHGEDGSRSSRIIQDSTDRCFQCCHRCDERPPLAEDNDSTWIPSLLDALARDRPSSHADDLASTAERTRPCRRCGHLATTDCSDPESHAREEQAYRVLLSDAQLYGSSIRSALQSLYSKAQTLRVLEFGLSVEQSSLASLVPSAIKSVDFVENGEFYDMTVPGPAHYSAGGVVSHNSGKTYMGARWAYMQLNKKPDTRVLGVGIAYDKHINRVMVHELQKLCAELHVKATYNKKTHELTLPHNGSQVLFGSAEDPLSLEGPHIDAAWMDEAGMMPRIAWEVAQRRTGYNNAPVLITTIPYFEGWLKTDVYDAWVNGDPSITWIACKTQDNKHYSEEEIERLRRTWRADKFERYVLGNWARPAGLIWPEPADKDLIVEPFDIPEHWPCFSGHDFGHNDPTTGVWGRLSNDDVLYIVADYEENGMTIDGHIRKWRERGLDVVDDSWGDPASPEVWERASDVGYPVRKANNDVAAGIDSVYERMITGRLKVFRGCKTWLDHRNTYRWAVSKNDDETFLDRPAKPQPAAHIADATRYLCMGINEYGQGVQVTPVMTSRRKGLIA